MILYVIATLSQPWTPQSTVLEGDICVLSLKYAAGSLIRSNVINPVPTLTPFWIEPEVLKTQRNLSKKLPPMESGGANWLQAVQRAVTGLMLTADEEAAAFFDQALSDHTLKTGHAPTASALHSQVFQAAILKGVPKSVVQAMETNPDLPGAEVDWW
ncbi:uncharacterized protein LOC133493838 isoform X2 [Syngnathoides biaculeatus]|uniref:uncharacterized protein LOC133493838 isoform X2 n=1 Tax=Syngnathoides biaculeatus TaxID=300417 RepID=UPI002ADE47A8|nr:uncharacterized protein LOC133493838 isoform X2 [Syngnathoides biaculeatus]